MEKEQILSTLKEKLGTTSLSDRTIENYVSRHLPAQGTEPDESFWSQHVSELQAFSADYSGQHNHEMATGRRAWEEQWNKEHPASSVKPAEQTDTDPAIAALQKQLKELQEQIVAEKKNSSVASIRQGVASKAEELKVTNRALWNDIVSTVQIGDGATHESVLGEAKKVYESKLKAYAGEGAQPYAGSGNKQPGSQAAEKEALARRAAFLDRMQKSGRLPASEK